LPTAPILFQPQFLWDDATVTREGTGFFAQAPGQRVAAISNVQYLRGNRPTLIEASWLGVTSDEPVMTFTRHWGKPGKGGTLNPADLREDYLLLPAEASHVPGESILKLDWRNQPAAREPVWLPVKDVDAPQGHRLIEGKVTARQAKYIIVTLNQRLSLASLNGSPVISQKTGRVIGALSRGGRLGESTLLILTPAEALRHAIDRAEGYPPLNEAFANAASERSASPRAQRTGDGR
jgi:hypothetical protein